MRPRGGLWGGVGGLGVGAGAGPGEGGHSAVFRGGDLLCVLVRIQTYVIYLNVYNL